MYIYFFPQDTKYHELNNLVNKLIDIRFKKVYDLFRNKQFEGEAGRDDKLDYARVTDVIEELTNVYTDEEEEAFIRQCYPKIECCVEAYNYDGFGYGRGYSIDSYENVKRSQEIFPHANYKAIMYFDVYLELDKLDKIFWNTQMWDFWVKCRDEVMTCQN